MSSDPFGRTVIVGTGNFSTRSGDDRAHYLLVVEGPGRGKRVELGREHVVIGREPPASLVVPDPQVSRKHCRVELILNDLFVTDLGSSNGTYVGRQRLTQPVVVAPGGRFSAGPCVFEHEWRSRGEVESAREADDGLEKAGRYVRALLPEPIAEGPVRADWVLEPCERVGGDCFGYRFLDDDTFVLFLLDVTGHGADAAMHAVSVLNVLRQPAGVEARDPAAVAAHLNAMFDMESHGGMMVSLWYGVFDLPRRTLTFTCAGQHPAYLVDAERTRATPLGVSNVMLGMVREHEFTTGQVQVPPGSTLYLFSDGAYEILDAGGRQWTLDDLVAILRQPPVPGTPEPRRVLEAVARAAGREAFEDDFTVLAAELT